jgi:uncharacterized protein (DUF1778 family)
MRFTRKKPISPKREYKTQRLELRLAPPAKKVIQQAIWVTGLAAGDLAYEGARRLLDEHQRMVLSGAGRDAFLAAVGRKPDPASRLVDALKRHRDLYQLIVHDQIDRAALQASPRGFLVRGGRAR